MDLCARRHQLHMQLLNSSYRQKDDAATANTNQPVQGRLVGGPTLWYDASSLCALSRHICSRKTALIQFAPAKSPRPLNSSRPITDTKRWRLSLLALSVVHRQLARGARGVAFEALCKTKAPQFGEPRNWVVRLSHWPVSVGRCGSAPLIRLQSR